VIKISLAAPIGAFLDIIEQKSPDLAIGAGGVVVSMVATPSVANALISCLEAD